MKKPNEHVGDIWVSGELRGVKPIILTTKKSGGILNICLSCDESGFGDEEGDFGKTFNIQHLTLNDQGVEKWKRGIFNHGWIRIKQAGMATKERREHKRWVWRSSRFVRGQSALIFQSINNAGKGARKLLSLAGGIIHLTNNSVLLSLAA